MNYRYKIDNEEVVLSQEEHAAVQEQLRKGNAIVILRSGTLAINTAFVRLFKETHALTEVQQANRDKYAALSAGTPRTDQIAVGFRRSHADFYKKMSWEHSENCPPYCEQRIIKNNDDAQN